MKLLTLLFLIITTHISHLALAQSGKGVDDQPTNAVLTCMSNHLKSANNSDTVVDLRRHCEQQKMTAFDVRNSYEQQVIENPFAILPHKPNYLLPFTYSNVDTDIYDGILDGEEFDPVEAKFQISIKYVAYQDFVFDNIDMQFAFTATSWWQTYNSKLSAPFRETNYEPEVIFTYEKPWQLFGMPIDMTYLSFNHQSNGKGGEFSRSWNRIIGGLVMSHGPVIYGVKAWWRIPEDEKETPDGLGDDNPDIEDFMGKGEIGALWQINDHHNLSIMLRNNFKSDNKGAITLGWSFPISSHLQGYVEYFNGYGESLIYYNERTQQIGVGIKLTDWL
ncbi:phospholipase A [Psychrobium sp. nBUS_13]|uniref:phospholipase A n=1 Tax=Psychrobium sp. nBUS_13 TaxID=3395319 RepID=UPI003EBAF0F5